MYTRHTTTKGSRSGRDGGRRRRGGEGKRGGNQGGRRERGKLIGELVGDLGGQKEGRRIIAVLEGGNERTERERKKGRK